MQQQPAKRMPFIDGFPFAETEGVLQGRWRIRDFERLQDALSGTEGEIEYEVRGARDDFGRLALRVRVSGSLELICQRCLGALPHELRIDELLVLARSEEEIEAQPLEPDSPDRILGSKEMAIGNLLEDEILLAIPPVPHHEECRRTGGETDGADRASPFAKLRGLLDQGGRGGN
jgi:uncharacterized protein